MSSRNSLYVCMHAFLCISLLSQKYHAKLNQLIRVHPTLNEKYKLGNLFPHHFLQVCEAKNDRGKILTLRDLKLAKHINYHCE